jgi:hypothetical protein
MRNLALLVALVVAPASAGAQVSLGLRLGYAKAQGNVGGQLNMDEWVNSQIPVQADVLVRVTPRLSIGAYGAWGFGSADGGDVKATCSSPGVSCSIAVIRAGVQGVWEFEPGSMTPWLGVGAGYEWNALHAENGSTAVDIRFTGFEWLNVQGGADWKVASSLSIGPFLMVSIGQYDSGHFGVSGAGGFNAEPSEKSIHMWLQIGVRGRVDL